MSALYGKKHLRLRFVFDAAVSQTVAYITFQRHVREQLLVGAERQAHMQFLVAVDLQYLYQFAYVHRRAGLGITRVVDPRKPTQKPNQPGCAVGETRLCRITSRTSLSSLTSLTSHTRLTSLITIVLLGQQSGESVAAVGPHGYIHDGRNLFVGECLFFVSAVVVERGQEIDVRVLGYRCRDFSQGVCGRVDGHRTREKRVERVLRPEVYDVAFRCFQRVNQEIPVVGRSRSRRGR